MKAINRTGRFAVIFLALCVIMTAFLGTVSFAADRPLGDADGDGIVTALDASHVLRYSVGMAELDAQSVQAADVDGNGTANAIDAALILRKAVGLIDRFPAESADDTASGSKTLVVYFTWSSTTKGMAENIANQTGADILEIIPSTPYPEDYSATGEIALAERDSNARPAISNLPRSIVGYDNIIIGYPIWWHTAPMIIGTFLESYDLSGVNIYPFAQSASMDEEQFANSMEFVRSCSGNGIVHDGLFTRPSDRSGITRYLNENGLM